MEIGTLLKRHCVRCFQLLFCNKHCDGVYKIINLEGLINKKKSKEVSVRRVHETFNSSLGSVFLNSLEGDDGKDYKCLEAIEMKTV